MADKKIKYEYQILTWGPCVVKLKVTPEFRELLLKKNLSLEIIIYYFHTLMNF